EIAASIVDAYIKIVAMVIDVILDVGSALPYQPPAAAGPVSRQVTHFAGGVTMALEQQVSTAAGELNVHLEALVFFFVHQCIPAFPQGMLPELVRALGDLVFGGVE